jgi:hypothetical protein
MVRRGLRHLFVTGPGAITVVDLARCTDDDAFSGGAPYRAIRARCWPYSCGLISSAIAGLGRDRSRRVWARPPIAGAISRRHTVMIGRPLSLWRAAGGAVSGGRRVLPDFGASLPGGLTTAVVGRLVGRKYWFVLSRIVSSRWSYG